MYITKVLSYNGAWEKLSVENEAEINEIKNIFENNDEIFFPEEWKKELLDTEDVNQSQKELSNYMMSSTRISNIFQSNNWSEFSFNETDKYTSLNVKTEKNSLILDFAFGMGFASSFLEYIFKMLKGNQTILNLERRIPVRVCLNDEIYNNRLSFGATNSWEKYVEELLNILPIPIEIPFVILGLGFEPSEMEVIEVESPKESIMLERCITFEPEYYQAGLGILTYFGTVLRDKYADQNATVKIEQQDLTVRMVIQSENGNIETIEKALHEYELVLKGETSPDDFAISPLKALELKNQLNLVRFQVESQKEIIAIQQGRILSLEAIVDKALSSNSHPPFTIINQLHNSQSTVINHKTEISKSNDDLEELIDLADNEALKNKLAMIQNALEINRNSDNPEEIKDSNGMKKLAKFLKEANEVGTEANDLAEKGGKAVDLIKSLGRSYNSIAQWCGMPIIPNIFVKE